MDRVEGGIAGTGQAEQSRSKNNLNPVANKIKLQLGGKTKQQRIPNNLTAMELRPVPALHLPRINRRHKITVTSA